MRLLILSVVAVALVLLITWVLTAISVALPEINLPFIAAGLIVYTIMSNSSRQLRIETLEKMIEEME